MKLYGAIDLHSNNNVTVLIDEQDQVVYQKAAAQRSAIDHPASCQAIGIGSKALSWSRPTTGTGWSTGLMDQGHRVHLAKHGCDPTV